MSGSDGAETGGIGGWRLDFRLCLKLHLSTLHLDRVHHRIAAVLLANLAGLFLDERREGIEVAGNFFSRLLLGFGKCPVEGFDLLPLGRRTRALYRKRLIHPRRRGARSLGVADQAICRMMLRCPLFVDAYALHRQERILWPPIALFANPHFLAPQVALNRVALRHLVVLKALRKTQPPAIAELAN